VAVTVTDRGGRAIAGLPKESFRIYDDKVEQQISFFSDEDTPASIGILFDTSGSMSGRTIERAKEALARFVQTSHPQDEFFLIAFSSRPHPLLDRVRDGKAVLDKFSFVQPNGDTALYDAVDMGIEKVSQGTYPKHAIILISDGEENHSRSSLGKVRRELEESGVVVYTLRVGSLPLPKSVGGMVMEQIAAVSGGKAFWPSNSERMDEAFEQIALDLRRQYSIGYLPSNFIADGKLHRIRVSVTVPRGLSREVVVRNRKGYYAVAKLTAR
jgi:Ca-activated chloride channel family protein